MATHLVNQPRYELPFTPEVAAATDAIRNRLKDVVLDVEWQLFAPYIAEINKLKVERNAVILAHNYQTPEIFHGVADIVGDSLALARVAAETQADTIVVAGVHFMAETAKILNPTRTVLTPDVQAGCSLASSITAEDVRLMRERYPGVPVVTYVNTSAAVKAESDICCTSGNVVELVRSLNVPRVICIPDKYLARYVANQTGLEVITWEGACEVHELFTPADITAFRQSHPGVVVLAHPECPEDVVAAADFTGSTAHMINYVAAHKPKRVVLVTECSMSDNVSVNFPEIDFVRPCNLCPHMKLITLPKILDSLRNNRTVIEVSEPVLSRARNAVERMLEIGKR